MQQIIIHNTVVDIFFVIEKINQIILIMKLEKIIIEIILIEIIIIECILTIIEIIIGV